METVKIEKSLKYSDFILNGYGCLWLFPSHHFQDGMLKPLLFKAITLKSYREHYCFKRSCTWNINEYDLNMGLLALCKKDPSASERIKHDALTLRDVEYIIEKASFGIIKLELDDYEY